MNYNELSEIINKGNAKSNWKEMHQLFGCHLANKSDANYLESKALEMIRRCSEWIANWKTVREGIKPELQAQREKNLDSKAKEFEGYSQEELDALMAKIQELRAA